MKALVNDALADVPNINLFAQLVKDQPGLFELLDPQSDYTILAPNDAAVKASTGVVGGGDGGVNPQLALSFVERAAADPALIARASTLKTSLEDPKYVNLGPGEPARLVSTPVAGGNLSIVAGLGKSVIYGGLGNSFAGGAVHVGDG